MTNDPISSHQIYFDPQSYWMKEFIEAGNFVEQIQSLETEKVLELASAIASSAPLEVVPGWRFNSDWDTQDTTVELRKLIWNHLKSENIDASIPFRWYYDLMLLLHFGNDTSSQLYVGGRYDPNEFYFLSCILTPGMTFIDIGANEGLYTLFGAKIIGSEGQVLSFEPSLREFQRLQKNLSLNHDMTNVRLFQLALSNKTGSQNLKIANSDHAGQNTFGDFVYEGVTCFDTEIVHTRRLDDLIEEMIIKQIDVIKIDVEGAELLVFEGSRSVMEHFRPLIFFELLDSALQKQGSSSAILLNHLRDFGYEIFSWGEFTGLPIKTNQENLPDGNLIAAHPSTSWKILSETEQAHAAQIELNKTQAAFKQTQDKLQLVQQAIVQFKTELQFTQEKLQEAKVELQQNKEMKEQIQTVLSNQIAAIESSKFWKLRNQWIALKKRLKLFK